MVQSFIHSSRLQKSQLKKHHLWKELTQNWTRHHDVCLLQHHDHRPLFHHQVSVVTGQPRLLEMNLSREGLVENGQEKASRTNYTQKVSLDPCKTNWQEVS